MGWTMRRSTATSRTSGSSPMTQAIDQQILQCPEGRSMIPASPAVEAAATAGGVVPASEGVQALLDASAMLLASVSVDAVVTRIVELARQIIKADAYAVWRTYDAHCWRVLAASGLSRDYRREWITKESVVPQFQAIPDVTRDDVVAQYGQIYK